jgi:hypothetical protein
MTEYTRGGAHVPQSKCTALVPLLHLIQHGEYLGYQPGQSSESTRSGCPVTIVVLRREQQLLGWVFRR